MLAHLQIKRETNVATSSAPPCVPRAASKRPPQRCGNCREQGISKIGAYLLKNRSFLQYNWCWLHSTWLIWLIGEDCRDLFGTCWDMTRRAITKRFWWRSLAHKIVAFHIMASRCNFRWDLERVHSWLYPHGHSWQKAHRTWCDLSNPRLNLVSNSVLGILDKFIHYRIVNKRPTKCQKVDFFLLDQLPCLIGGVFVVDHEHSSAPRILDQTPKLRQRIIATR